MIPFQVEEQALEKALDVIALFVDKVNANEPDTIMYKSFQDNNDPTKFIHVMSFKDEGAQEIHRTTTYCKEFVEALYPICSVSPSPTRYREVR